jgi:tRNA A-37 threonylcarbamoyl transferase component Bud32
MSQATGWRLMPDVDPVAAARFADLDSVFALDGEIVARDSMSLTLRVDINGRRYYAKRYAGLGKKPLRRWLATPRVQLEWQNLAHFADWGIPTARLVGYGLENGGGRFLRGALITAEIPDTIDLGWLAYSNDPRLKNRRWLDGTSRQLAAIARAMHSRRFVHGDFKWRNLLVDGTDTLYLIDCPSGGFWWPPFLEYRVVKDLACLDKLARHHLSRSRRLRFYLAYAQKQSLDAGDKRRIRSIVGFFSGRDEAIATAASLRAAGRNPLPQTRVALDDGSLLVVQDWLRVLPGKRLTGSGEWRGRKALAKLFIAERGSERHWQRECRGAENLRRHGLPTPALLASGLLGDGGHYVLYDCLDRARNPEGAALEDLMPVFAQVGRMHAGGLVQEDAHLGNFLLEGDRLYVIDGDAIRESATPADCTGNLALLLAQLQPQAEAALRADLLQSYRSGNPGAAVDEVQLAATSASARQRRLADYLDKCLRDCSLFASAHRTDRFFSIVRAENNPARPADPRPGCLAGKGRAPQARQDRDAGAGGSEWAPVGHQALQHQGPRPCAVAQLAAQSRLAFLAGGASPGFSRHRHAAPPRAGRTARRPAARQGLADHRILRRCQPRRTLFRSRHDTTRRRTRRHRRAAAATRRRAHQPRRPEGDQPALVQRQAAADRP